MSSLPVTASRTEPGAALRRRLADEHMVGAVYGVDIGSAA